MEIINMKTKTILAWHFVADTLRDGSPIPPDGAWLKHTGGVIPCKSGLHASIDPFDALIYAPGNTLCRVELRGTIKYHEDDKIVASKRRILWRVDATDMLRSFARGQALAVADLWEEMPAIVREYLETGDYAKRSAARVAAYDAAYGAGYAAATGVGYAAARVAAAATVYAAHTAAAYAAYAVARVMAAAARDAVYADDARAYATAYAAYGVADAAIAPVRRTFNEMVSATSPL
jgi:hypothetical protein